MSEEALLSKGETTLGICPAGNENAYNKNKGGAITSTALRCGGVEIRQLNPCFCSRIKNK